MQDIPSWSWVGMALVVGLLLARLLESQEQMQVLPPSVDLRRPSSGMEGREC